MKMINKNKFISFLTIIVLLLIFAEITSARRYDFGRRPRGRVIFSTEGLHTVNVCNNDNDCANTTFRIDKSPPICGSVTYNPSGLTNGSVRATVVCSDAYSGCASPSFSDTFATNGSKTVTIRDKVGWTTNCSVTISNIDKDSPTCGSTSAVPSSWTNGTVLGSVRCNDSDCRQPVYSTTFSSNGTKTVTISDKLGNTANCNITVSNIDSSAPSCGTISKSPSSWTTGNVYASVNCSDSGGSNCQSASFGKNFTNNGSAWILIKDNAGNTKNCYVSVSNIDRNKPSVPRPNDSGVFSTAASLTFSASPSDSQSGLAACYAQIDVNNTDGAGLAMAKTNIGIDGDYTFLGSNGNTYYYRYYCIDNVGNQSEWSEWSNGIMVDTKGPKVTLWSPSNPNWINKNTDPNFQTFQATCSDSESGCIDNFYYCHVSDHNEACTVNITDNAGNTATSENSPKAKIDRLEPQCTIIGDATGEEGWFLTTDDVLADCTDQDEKNDSPKSGKSGCAPNPDPAAMQIPPDGISLSVKDIAGNATSCHTADLKVHYIEIRGLQDSQSDPSVKQELTNTIRQNVAGLTRNGTPNETPTGIEDEPVYNLNNGTIAYYEGDITFSNDFTVTDKRTIIVKNGSLTLNGNITYDSNNLNSILGIIVLGTENSHGNVTIASNVGTINAILFAEGTLLSENQLSLTQLYWKGSVITDNTIGGYTKTPKECAEKRTVCNNEKAKSDDLNFFRSYHYTINGAIQNDPKGSKAPSIIEYDSSVQQNTPYGFKVPSEFSFEEIIK